MGLDRGMALRVMEVWDGEMLLRVLGLRGFVIIVWRIY